MIDKHIISVLVENRFGVLAKIASLFSGRGYNIDSLSVAETDDPTISRMTIVVSGDEMILEQVIKQLNKLIDVIKVSDITKEIYLERELMLIKVKSGSRTRSEIIEIADVFRAKIVDVGTNSLIIESTGTKDKNEAILTLLRPFGIKELVRTGKVAIVRGDKK